MKKSIQQLVRSAFKPAFPGLSGIDLMASRLAMEPFLVVTEFYMDRPVFGPHPHAGISVMTYILPDSENAFINRDSFGDFSEILPGGVHVTQAGKGIQHDEFPKKTGVSAHGFQIWINHAAKDRLVAPKAMKAAPYEIPQVTSGGAMVRILHGTFENQSSPIRLVTDVLLFHLVMAPGSSLSIPAFEQAFLHGLLGSALVNNSSVSKSETAIFDEIGNEITIVAGNNGAEFLFGSGRPHHEPIVYGGPFVMNTPEDIQAAKRRFQRGEMGILEPIDTF